jgi:hypothetical protein
VPLVIHTEGSTLRIKMPLVFYKKYSLFPEQAPCIHIRVIFMSLTTAPNFETLKEVYRKFPAYFRCPLAYHEATLTNRNTAPLILKLGARWKWSVSLPGHFTAGETAQPNSTAYEVGWGPGQARTLRR